MGENNGSRNAKAVHRGKLLEILGNPDVDFLDRKHYAAVLGINPSTLYKHFDVHELADIEDEAVTIRRKSCSKQRQEVLKALYKSAIGFSVDHDHISCYKGKVTVVPTKKYFPPNKAAGQEFLDRTEGKVLDRTEISGKDGAPLVPVLNVTVGKK